MTVLEAIQRCTGFLARKGVESPRLQTELLLAHVLKLPRMQLYLNFERSLTEFESGAFRECVVRRAHKEPLQHILGTACFCGLELIVNRHVLVPRPETELLAEQGRLFLEQLSAARNGDALHSEPLRVLDFGTGSGCIAILLAVKNSSVQVCATDISSDALAVAKENATRLNVAGQIEFRQGDGLSAVPAGSKFSLIISNPPYIATGEIDNLQPEVRDHDPRAALDGGPDGLRFFDLLARNAGPFLAPGGRLLGEFGDGQAADIQKLFGEENWVVEAILDDYTQRPRILIARSNKLAGETPALPSAVTGPAQDMARSIFQLHG